MKHSRKLLLALLLMGILIAVPSITMVRASSAASSRPSATQRGALLSRVAGVLGVTATVLKQDLQAGETLLQIAGARYASADALAGALFNAFQEQFDRVTTALKLTDAQKQALQTRIQARLVKLVTTPHPRLAALAGPALAGAVKGLHAAIVSTLVATCNTTAANLQAAFKTGGQTPLAICQSTNPSVSEKSLVMALMQTIRKQIAPLVKSKNLSGAQKQQILQHLRSRVTHFVTTIVPAHS